MQVRERSGLLESCMLAPKRSLSMLHMQAAGETQHEEDQDLVSIAPCMHGHFVALLHHACCRRGIARAGTKGGFPLGSHAQHDTALLYTCMLQVGHS